VPLYPTTQLQARRDLSFCAWSSMCIEIGCSRYLGFLVGPRANADNNFSKPIEKFRSRTAYWLSCPWLGAYFQTLGFNMFALSVLNFTSQLYVPSTAFLEEANTRAGRLLHGPGYWLWGDKGHAFF
jgi:hypothetical protein